MHSSVGAQQGSPRGPEFAMKLVGHSISSNACRRTSIGLFECTRSRSIGKAFAGSVRSGSCAGARSFRSSVPIVRLLQVAAGNIAVIVSNLLRSRQASVDLTCLYPILSTGRRRFLSPVATRCKRGCGVQCQSEARAPFSAGCGVRASIAGSCRSFRSASPPATPLSCSRWN